ncbi:MAG: hypothetical protein AB7Y46_13150 [Armatimonadota bacterium]
MRQARWVLVLAMALAACYAGPGWAQPARPAVLLEVHGYNHAGAVQVPLWPLTDWLGATVRDGGDWAVIVLGPKAVYLQLPRQAWLGETPVVPLRGVAEGLGAQIRYHGADSEVGAGLGHIPAVEVTIGDRRGLVLVHRAHPRLVAELVKAVRDEAYGRDWLLQVSAVSGDYVKTHEPQWREESGFSQHWITGVLQRQGDGWRYLLRSSKVSHTEAELSEAGVSLEVARQLGMEIEEM